MPDSRDLPPILQSFGRDLTNAMNAGPQQRLRRGRDLDGWARRLRVPILVFGCLLAITTIALAATGVILTGAPVRPEELLNPNVGEGIPAPGASRLLPLQIADPEGGLPWGMRVVHTTRGEVCLQVGRLQNGQLGVLGIDAAFHDDGRFHPIPADALPRDSFHGRIFDASWGVVNANTSCQLSGQAVASSRLGVDRGAAATPSRRPLRYLRDVSYGLLGPEAVSVRYRSGATHYSEAVVPGVGAYLIVQRTMAGQQIGTSGGSFGTEGDLAPIAPLTTITYRLNGKLCERGPSLPPGGVAHLVDPCPWPHFPKSSARTVELHQPIGVHLQISGHLITAVQLSFKAPYPVSSAREDYSIDIPNADASCGSAGAAHGRAGGEATGYAQSAIGRDIAKGETVSHQLDASEVFSGVCARPGAKGRLSIRQFALRSATIQVRYRRTGESSVLVGSITVRVPAGIRPAPPPAGPPRRH
jgi:hypothetical protein